MYIKLIQHGWQETAEQTTVAADVMEFYNFGPVKTFGQFGNLCMPVNLGYYTLLNTQFGIKMVHCSRSIQQEKQANDLLEWFCLCDLSNNCALWKFQRIKEIKAFWPWQRASPGWYAGGVGQKKAFKSMKLWLMKYISYKQTVPAQKDAFMFVQATHISMACHHSEMFLGKTSVI